MIDLTGKVALITGGTRGIGKSTAVMMAQAGADLVLGYHHDEAEARQALTAVKALGGRVSIFGGDLGSPTVVKDLFKHIESEFGGLDILVANAGIWKRSPLLEMTAAEWRDMMRANLDSVFFTCQKAAEWMVPRKQGKMVLISSTAGVRGEAFHAHYAASKGALISLTKSLASELGYHNINVNCVAPGWVETGMTAEVFRDENFRNTVEQSIPLRRIAQPEDIAGVVTFLASELARHLQGEVVNVNGGSVLV